MNNYKIGYLEIFENLNGEIAINDTYFEQAVSFDECMAEKICKSIMKVAQEIRQENKED